MEYTNINNRNELENNSIINKSKKEIKQIDIHDELDDSKSEKNNIGKK